MEEKLMEIEAEFREREELIKQGAFFSGIKFILSDSEKSREFICYFEIMNRLREVKDEVLDMQHRLNGYDGVNYSNEAGILANKIGKFRESLKELVIGLATQSYQDYQKSEAID